MQPRSPSGPSSSANCPKMLVNQPQVSLLSPASSTNVPGKPFLQNSAALGEPGVEGAEDMSGCIGRAGTDACAGCNGRHGALDFTLERFEGRLAVRAADQTAPKERTPSAGTMAGRAERRVLGAS